MRDAYLTAIIIKHLLNHLPSCENFKNVAKHSFVEDASEPLKCEAFLCRGECFNVSDLIANGNGKFFLFWNSFTGCNPYRLQKKVCNIN